MNIIKLLLPKNSVAIIRDDFTLRQGLEKLRYYGYAAIPVITKDSKYAGTISEGDFLWYLMEREGIHKTEKKELEHVLIKDILPQEKNPAVFINARIEDLLVRAMNQNFIPVIDDRGIFIGIVTRKDIIKWFYEHSGCEESIWGELEVEIRETGVLKM